jgi:hypothetical protein
MDDAIILPRDHAQAYALTFPGAYAEHPSKQKRPTSTPTLRCAC